MKSQVLVLGVMILMLSTSGCVQSERAASQFGKSQIAFHSNREGNLDIYIMNADGTGERRLTIHPAEDSGPDWSPDGSLILFVSNRDGNRELYVIQPDGTGLKRLTNSSFSENSPKWSPDGSQIAYYSRRDGKSRIFTINADGTNETPVTDAGRDHLSPAWSPDGQWFATESAESDKGFNDPNHPRRNQIWIQRVDGSELRQITSMEAYNGYPAWSPYGARIVFDSNPAGRETKDTVGEICVVNSDGSGYQNLTNSLGYSAFADWSQDGQYIAFVSIRDGNNEIYIMRADGSLQTRITNNSYSDEWPSWSPF